MLEGTTKKMLAQKPRSLFGLLFCLALFPLILGSLFCFGQLAMLVTTKSLTADTRSRLSVDYKTWLYQIIPGIDLPKILEDIQKEEIALGTPVPGVVATGPYWVPPTPTLSVTPAFAQTLAILPTATNTATQAFATAIPSPTSPVLSQTPTQTATPFRTWTTAPTYTNTVPPATATSPSTNTPVPSPTRTRTPTARPPTATLPPPTATPTVPTATQAPPPPAPTYAPIFPLAENGGSSRPVAGGCQADFGYQNDNPQAVDIQIGMRNVLSDEGAVVSPGQPTHFQVGRVGSVFSVTWTTAGPLIWSLDGRSAAASWCNP